MEGQTLSVSTGISTGTAPSCGQPHTNGYSPGHLAWSLNYYDLESYGELTEQQQRMLFPPSIGNRPKVDENL